MGLDLWVLGFGVWGLGLVSIEDVFKWFKVEQELEVDEQGLLPNCLSIPWPVLVAVWDHGLMGQYGSLRSETWQTVG